jgi:hypothetical protein
MDVSIPVRFCSFIPTGFLRTDVNSCQKANFLDTGCLRKCGKTSVPIETVLILKLLKCLFQVTYHTNIFSTIMFSGSSVQVKLFCTVKCFTKPNPNLIFADILNNSYMHTKKFFFTKRIKYSILRNTRSNLKTLKT